MDYSDIRFPHLGIVFSHVGRSIQIGNFTIMYYGIIVAFAFLAGYFVVRRRAAATGQDPDFYLDYFLCMMLPAIIGARIYYVVFSWDYYSRPLPEIFKLRQGGLGIVGGVSMSILVLIIFCRIRKARVLKVLDTLTTGCLTGQIIGRWGNFFNREAFGAYTDGPLAMQIPLGYFKETGRSGELMAGNIMDHLVRVMRDGVSVPYIQVHPTFLYEGLCNLLIIGIIILWRRKQRFEGELFCIYLMGYGLARFFIESLRIDQLTIGSTGIPATQVVCVLIAAGGLAGMIHGRRKAAAKTDPES